MGQAAASKGAVRSGSKRKAAAAARLYEPVRSRLYRLHQGISTYLPRFSPLRGTHSTHILCFLNFRGNEAKVKWACTSNFDNYSCHTPYLKRFFLPPKFILFGNIGGTVPPENPLSANSGVVTPPQTIKPQNTGGDTLSSWRPELI